MLHINTLRKKKCLTQEEFENRNNENTWENKAEVSHLSIILENLFHTVYILLSPTQSTPLSLTLHISQALCEL